MKLRTHRMTRKGDHVSVTASWTDRTRKPASASLVLKRDQELSGDEKLVEGDIVDVSGALFGLAEIAWSMGWRPRGLMGNLSTYVQNYRIPPEDR